MLKNNPEVKKFQKLYLETPLLESITLTKVNGLQTYTKMDNGQPSGSYKIRGIGHLISKKVIEGITHLVCASGGNAGMATAYSGRILNISVTIVLPKNAQKLFVSKLQSEGAEVMIHGDVWDEANEKALELCEDEKTLYVPPFDHPLIWEGVSTIVPEILRDCPMRPSAIVISVGGGGLLCGLMEGLQRLDLDIPIIAMETEGADCFNAALKAGKRVSIGNITSIAKTLGALQIVPRALELLPKSTVISKVITDKQAVDACVQFANDSRVLVEPSCGATLAAGYSGIIRQLVDEGKIKTDGCIVFIVCGGNGATLDMMEEWQKMVADQ